MKPKQKTGKSPYVKYEKLPYQYSELYRRWRSARLAGREDEAWELAREHAFRSIGARIQRTTEDISWAA